MQTIQQLKAARLKRTPPPGLRLHIGHVTFPAGVRRTVYERDQGRCRYVDDRGRRCTARLYLELHGMPYAVGGEHSPTINLSLLCAMHNRLMAEIDFGAEAIGSHRRETASASAAPELGVDRLGRPTTPAPAAP